MTQPTPVAPILTVVGSANVDLVARVRSLPRPGETVAAAEVNRYAGGKGLNQAVAAARSGCHTRFVGAVGDDESGVWLRSLLVAEGIEDAVEQIHGESTGLALIGVDDAGENQIMVHPGANRSVRIGTTAAGSRVLLTQLEIGVEACRAALMTGRQQALTTVLNPAPATTLDDDLLGLVDIAVPNQHEVELLGGVERLLAAGVGCVIVTRGAEGSVIHTPRSVTSVPARPAAMVDSTGAGDAFCGVLAASLAGGLDLDDAVARASAAGALATEVRGAVPSLPYDAAIARRLLD